MSAYVEYDDQSKLKAITFCKSEDLYYEYIQNYGHTPSGQEVIGPVTLFTAVPTFVKITGKKPEFERYSLTKDEEFSLKMKSRRFSGTPSWGNFSLNIENSLLEEKLTEFPWNKNALEISFPEEKESSTFIFTQKLVFGCL